MRNKSTSEFFFFILTCLFTTLFTNNVVAQSLDIYELKDNTTSKNSSKKGTKNNREEFYNLSKNLHPTFYLENNRVKKKYGNGAPEKLTFEDANSFDKLNNSRSNYNNVKLITIVLKKQSDLNNALDLSDNKRFPNLKYIYIKCLFNSNRNQINKFIKKPNKKVRVFYTFQKAS